MLLRDLIQRYDDSGSCDEQDYEALRAFFEKTCYEYDYNISLDDHDDA